MRSVVTALLVLALAIPACALAHAFPEKSSPHVGATVSPPPHDVKVWFDGELEPVFSTLIVKNAKGKPVSAGAGRVDAHQHNLLETTFPTKLASGTYTVYWSVIAHDGHHTAGHFTFTVK